MNNTIKERIDLHDFVNNWVNQVMMENQIPASMMEDALTDAIGRVREACIHELMTYMSEQIAVQRQENEAFKQRISDMENERAGFEQVRNDLNTLQRENTDLKRKQKDYDNMQQEMFKLRDMNKDFDRIQYENNSLLSKIEDLEARNQVLEDMVAPKNEVFVMEDLSTPEPVKTPTAMPGKPLSGGNRHKKKGV